MRHKRNWLAGILLSGALLGCQPTKKSTPVTPPPNYRVVLQWGSPGSGPGQFNGAQGLALDSEGSVYVADSQNCRIEVFGPAGQFLRSWGRCGNGPGEFQRPMEEQANEDEGISKSSIRCCGTGCAAASSGAGSTGRRGPGAH